MEDKILPYFGVLKKMALIGVSEPINTMGANMVERVDPSENCPNPCNSNCVEQKPCPSPRNLGLTRPAAF